MQLTDIRIKLCDTHGSYQGNLHGNIHNGSHDGTCTKGDARGSRRLNYAGHHNANANGNGNVNGNHAAQGNRLKAFCALTIDGAFVIRDVKLIDGNDGLFVAMPSRKICDRCARCGDKNHLRARYCNNCGARLDENRVFRTLRGGRPGYAAAGNGFARVKLHADIAHPIHADCRQGIEQEVIDAYWQEVEKSKLPGYVPPNLDGEDVEFLEARLDSRLDSRPPTGDVAGDDSPISPLPLAGEEATVGALGLH